MSPIFFALISYFGWGVGDFFGAIVSKKIGGYLTSFWLYLFSTILLSFYAPFVISDLKYFNLYLLFFCLALSVVGTIPLISFYESVKEGNASIMGAVSGSFPALVVILSVIFFKEQISQKQIFTIILILIGLFLSSLDLLSIRKTKIKTDKNILLAFTAMILWGVYFTIIKIPIQEMGWFWPLYISNLFSLFLLFFYMKIKKMPILTSLNQKLLPKILICTTLIYAGDFAFNIGISKSLTSLIAPIAGSYPTIFVILSALAFKDKITKQQILGIFITLLGIVLLSFFSA